MDKLDDLLLLEKLAAGGMAEVYRAIQQGYGGFEKVVAVKRILPHFASDEEFKNMFVMEAQLSALMQHPNVVQVFTNGESAGYLYLVMEFVDGKNLRQLLARADKSKVRIPIEDACFIIAEAAKGLEYAHSFIDPKTGQGMEIVHRDMSPQNIMLSYDGGIKIVDFGIAKAAARSENTRAGVLKGKFGYMSPEQAQGMPIDRRTDIFALGIIFFELLTQRRLFSHDDDMRTLQLIRECNIPRPSKYNPAISPALDRIVLKALAKNRSDRYANAGELYADVQRFMNQKYPNFLPMEFARFLKTKIFAEDIAQERKKREALAAEAPARMGANTQSRRKVTMPDSSTEVDKDSTQLGDMDEVSQITSNSEIRDLGAPQMVNEVSPKLDVSELNDPSDFELSPPAKTRLVGSPDPLPNPKDQSSAFSLGSGPSHLSLSVAVSERPLPMRKSVPVMRPTSDAPPPSQYERPTLQSTPMPSTPAERPAMAGDIELVSGGPGIRAFGGRSFIMVLALAAMGAYWHFSSSKPQSQVATNIEVESKAKVDSPPVAVQSSADDSDRKPAAAQPGTLDAPVYMPGDATGYLNFKTFPSATAIYVDGRILVDREGAPVRSPANLQKVDVGRHKIVVRNKALGLSWEGEVEIEFDSVKTLEVRLK